MSVMSKATNWKAGPKEAEYEIKRERIVHAASSVIAKHGLAGLKLEAIAEAAQINRSTYYRYFGSKDELIKAVLENEFITLGEEIREKTDNISEPIDRIIEGVFQTIQAHRSNKRLVKLLGPDSKSCVHLNRMTQEFYPQKTAPLVASILGVDWNNADDKKKENILLLVHWILNAILSLAIFGCGKLKPEEERDLLFRMLGPALISEIANFN